MTPTRAASAFFILLSSAVAAQPQTAFPAGFSERAKSWLACAGKAKILGDPLATDLGFPQGGLNVKQKGIQTSEPPAQHFLQLADDGKSFVIAWRSVDKSLQIAWRANDTGELRKTIVTTETNTIGANDAYAAQYRDEIAFWDAEMKEVFAADPGAGSCGRSERGS